MRTMSNLWSMLVARDSTVLETVAVINNVEYSTITSPVIHSSLLSSDTLSVGNCIASSLTFTVMTTDVIPKSAKVVIKCRLVDGSVYTTWYEFGTFYVSKREYDDDLVTLECYDAMLKGNQVYGGSSSPMNWPKPMQTVLNEIVSRMGITLDSRTSIRSDSTNYKCEYPGDMTLLEVLGYIGACNGGNWIITPENKLRLVPLTGSGSTVNIPVVLSAITTADRYTITGVTMSIDEDHVYSAGSSSGFVLAISSNPYASQTITNNLYNMLNGLTYQPFVASCAMYDPAAELGDIVTIGNTRSMLINESRTYDLSYRFDAEAPGKDELEDEYPYPSELLRLQQSTVELKNSINDAVLTLSSQIEQTQTGILLSVSQTYETKTDASSKLATAENYTDGKLTSYYTKTETVSQINQKADSITSSVSQTYETKTAASGKLTEAKSYTDSKITQTATEIRSEVRSKTDQSQVESIISQKADSIRLKADKISWSSTYSSMTEDGVLTCQGASIYGDLHTENTLDNNWLDISGGRIYGGVNSGSEIGSIRFGYLYQGGPNGINISCDTIWFDAHYIFTDFYDFDHQNWAVGQCYSGTIQLVTDIWDNGNGVSWTTKSFRFQNGLLLV